MDILQVRYFSKVYETLNYAHAADQLYVSRQALRKVIHNVEREVGQALFVNEANRLHPTPCADQLYKLTRDAVVAFDRIDDGIAGMRLQHSNIIRLGQSYEANDIFSRSERRAFISMPASDRPISHSYRITMGSTSDIFAALLEGRLDYAHVIANAVDQSRFAFEVAREGRIYLLVDKDNPLANRDMVTVSDLEGIPMAMQPLGNDISDLIMSQARLRGFDIDVLWAGNGLHERVSIVQGSLSLGEHIATFGYSDQPLPNLAPDVVGIPFEEPFMSWAYGVIASKDRANPQLMNYFAGREIDWDAYRDEVERERQIHQPGAD